MRPTVLLPAAAGPSMAMTRGVAPLCRESFACDLAAAVASLTLLIIGTLVSPSKASPPAVRRRKGQAGRRDAQRQQHRPERTAVVRSARGRPVSSRLPYVGQCRRHGPSGRYLSTPGVGRAAAPDDGGLAARRRNALAGRRARLLERDVIEVDCGGGAGHPAPP